MPGPDETVLARRIWFSGFANPRAFLATSLAVRLCASAFAFERTVECA